MNITSIKQTRKQQQKVIISEIITICKVKKTNT
jgi:hypothetical protein